MGDVNGKEMMERIVEAHGRGDYREAGLIELQAYAEAKVPGSGRLVLSYVASQAYSNLNKQYHRDVLRNPKWDSQYTDKSVPPEVVLENKKAVVNGLFKHMYVADKQTWSTLMFEVVAQKYPTLLQWRDNKNMQFFSALNLVDLMGYGEAKL